MNKKNPKDVRGFPVTIRLTKEEKIMARDLRVNFNVNISSLVRNAIRIEYKERLK